MSRTSTKAAQRVFIITVLALLSLYAYSTDSTRHQQKRNLLFVTVGGFENRGSINFEHIFSAGRILNWSYSIGLQPFNLPSKLSVPFSINAFTRGRLHHLEVDLVAVFFMNKYHPYNGGRQNDFNKQIYLTPFLCYRLQGSRGLFIKTGVGPQFLFDPPSNAIANIKTTVLQPSVFGSLGLSF
jgi:hypothetical protein